MAATIDRTQYPALASALVTVLIVVAVALVIWFVVERFSPDPLITKICQVIIFVVVVAALVMKLLPLI